jgi:type VI secretion system protein ImpE
MSTPSAALLDSGDLDGAIESLSAEVRRNAADTSRRAMLAELLCFAGELERADRMLDAIAELDPSLSVGVALFQHLLRAEQARQRFYLGGDLPEFIDKPTQHEQMYLKALILLRDGEAASAAQLLDEAEQARVPLAGKLNGEPFPDLRDADDICATHMDVLTSNGKFYWIPLDRVSSVTFHRPARRRDLLWRRATMDVRGGPSGDVFVAAIYPPAGQTLTAAQRLGHQTDFVGGNGAQGRGLGLRDYLVGQESRTILEMIELELGPGG